MEMEIICISSDDESRSQKENKTTKSVANFIKPKSFNNVEIVSSDDEKVEENNRKRKISRIKGDKIIHNIVEKKKKLDVNQDTSKITKRLIPMLLPNSKLNFKSDVCKVYPVAESDTTNQDEEIIIEKLNLIVKEKKKISYITHDMFPVFISFCLQIAPADEKKDMEKIINKLKRHYDRLDLTYVSSQKFALFLNEKREAIMNNNHQKYIHITDVKNEMKRNSKKTPNSSDYDAVPSTSYAANNLNSNNIMDSDYEDDIAINVSPKTKRKIKQILLTMKKCEAAIKKLEEVEVDFNEENDSSYIKVEKYKQRMVQLYDKYCELTGDSTDAGRVYLRPKHLNPTGIVVVDHAITNFINSKIIQRNKRKKIGALTDDLIFPDYRDILQCVTRCNNIKNLGLDEKKQRQLAKKAFQELGKHLQRSRKNDYWDTFSLYLENAEEDPATKDQTLKNKLDINRTEGNKRLTAIFEKYVKLAEEQNNADEIASEEEEDEDDEEEDNDEEEDIINDKDKSKNNLPLINLSDEDNEKIVNKTTEDINKTIKENKLSLEKDKNNINIVNQDIDISNKTIADKSPEHYNKKVEIVFAKENNAVSKNEIANKPIADKSPEQCNEKVKIVSVKENDAVSKNEISNKPIAEKSSEQCNEKVKIVSAKENDAVSKNEISNKPIAEKSSEQCNEKVKIVFAKENDAVSKNEILNNKSCTDNTMGPKIQKSMLPASKASCTTSNVNRIEEDLTEAAIQDALKQITDSMKETMDIADTTITNVANISKDVEMITGNGPDIMGDEKDNEIDNEIDIMGYTIDATNVPSENQSEVEKKPLLRVRSFAKPPMTWKDSQHNTNKTVQENVPKIINQKELIDLTDETVTKPLTNNKEIKVKKSPFIAKCAIKVGDKIIPVINKKTLIIPSKNVITVRNITSVQNITKNYLKVDKETGKLISSVKVPGSKIFRLPPVQVNANRQIQQQNTNMIFGRQEVPLRGNETIIQVVPSGKPILLPKRKTVQVSLSKQNECSQATKPK